MAGGALVTLLAALVLVAVACGGDDDDRAPTTTVTASPQPGVAVVYREAQCLGNPWEEDWLDHNPGARFPSHGPTRQMIFEDYWRDHGLELAEVRRERYLKDEEVVCQGCDCPTGFEWRASLPEDDLDRALSAGFERAP